MKRAIFSFRVVAASAGLCFLLATSVVGQTVSPSGQWRGKSLEQLVAGLQQIASRQGASTVPLMRAAYTDWLDARDREAVDRELQALDADVLVALAQRAEQMQATGGYNDDVATLVDAVRTEGAVRLGILEQAPDSDHTQMEKMYDVGWRKLSREDRAASARQLLTLDKNVQDWSVTELRKMFYRLKYANLHTELANQMAAKWLEAAEASPPKDISRWDISELLRARQYTYLLGFAAKDFSVRWTGYVKTPSTGKYRFSGSPVNTNYDTPSHYVRQTMKVWVKGQQVLDSTPDNWQSEGEPISLEAGRKTPIRVEYTCSREGQGYRNPFVWPAVAMLFWEGPGCAKAVVPSSALSVSQAGTSASGLQAEYELTLDESRQKETVKRIESAIDHLWTQETLSYDDVKQTAPVVPKYPTMSRMTADELASRAMDPANLKLYTEILAGRRKAERHEPPFSIKTLEQVVPMFTRRQKAELAAQVLAEPSLMAAHEEIPTRLFWLLYPAAPDETLELLSAWAQAHPNVASPIVAHPLWINAEYRELMSALFWGRRPDFEALEQRYLEMPDGTCCLPVAYIATYGHAVDGSLDEWIARLDERLADKSLQGDRRVNWLLARAKVEELRYGVRQGGDDHDWLLTERSLAGRGWIETACLVASSEPVRLRAYRELVARLAADEQQVDAARQMIQGAASHCTSPESTAEMAQWRQQIDSVAGRYRYQDTRRNELADKAYIDRLRVRYQRATDAGDEATMIRYGKMISDAEVNGP